MDDIQFFKKYRKELVWFINTKLGRWFFKVDNEIQNICKITPNALTYDKHLERRDDGKWYEVKTTCFRTNNKYARLLNYRLRHLHKLAFTIPSLLKPEMSPLFVPVMLTTDSFYPDANPESTSVDGSITAGGSDKTWTNIISESGLEASDSSEFGYYCAIYTGASADTWRYLMRSMFLFDTSSLPNDDTVDSATLSLYGTSKRDQISIAPDLNVYAASPSSNTSLSSSDFDKFGSTAFSTAITYNNFSTTGYNDFSLNASGIAAISKTGISKFGVRNANYDAAGSSPTYTAWDQDSKISGYFAENTGTSEDPKLTVTHSAAVSTYVKTIQAKGRIKIPNIPKTVQVKERIKQLSRSRMISAKGRIKATKGGEISAASYSDSYQSGLGMRNGLNEREGQSFMPVEDCYLSEMAFYLFKEGAPTGYARAELYAHSGTFGVSSLPTGSPLATSEPFDVSTLTTQKVKRLLNFNGDFLLEESTPYVMMLNYEGGDSNNYIVPCMADDGSTAAGNFCYYPSEALGWLCYDTVDLSFEVYGILTNTAALAKASIAKTTTRMISGKSRTKKAGIGKSVQSKSLVKATGRKIISSRGRVKVPGGVYKTGVSSRANISKSSTKLISSKSRVRRLGTARSLQAKSDLKRPGVIRAATAKSRMKKTGLSDDVAARARVKNQGVSSLSAEGRIKTAEITKTITARSRTKKEGTAASVSSRANILNALHISSISAKTRVFKSGIIKVITGKAYVENSFIKEAEAKARIKVSDKGSSIISKARIKGSYSAGVQAKSRILGEKTASVAAKASVKKSGSAHIRSMARVKMPGVISSIGAKARIWAFRRGYVQMKGNDQGYRKTLGEGVSSKMQSSDQNYPKTLNDNRIL